MAYKSDFQKVVEFNHQFGVHLHKSPQFDIFSTEPNNVEFCLKLIREEIRELNDAINTKDYIETIDALADIIYVVMGMSARLGTDMDEVFHIIIKMIVARENTLPLQLWFTNNSNRAYKFDSLTSSDIPSNFQQVLEYCSEFNETKHMSFKHIQNCKLILTTLECINNSLTKLEFYSKTKQNYVKTIKYLGIILYYSYYMSTLFETNMDKAFDIVHENNMSKLCSTESDAKESVEWYLSQKEKLGYDSPNSRKAPDNKHWVVYNESTKKILKSIKWKPVDLTILYKS